MAMSKKPRKPRASKQAVTSQKSSDAVRSDDATSSITTELANPPEVVPETAEPAQAVHNTADASPMTLAIAHQSIIPPTDDIDDGWGSEDDDEQNSIDSATVQPTETAKPAVGLPVRAESAGSTKTETTNDAPTPNKVSEEQPVPTHKSASSSEAASVKSEATAPSSAAPSSRPTAADATPIAPSVAPSRPSAAPATSVSATPPPKSPVVVNEVSYDDDGAPRSAVNSSFARARSSTPASGITSARSGAAVSTAPPASSPPSRRATPSQGMASAPPPPSARGHVSRETIEGASEVASRPPSRRPSQSPGVSATPLPPSSKSVAPRDMTDVASRVVTRPSRSPATLRPSAIASLATHARTSKPPSQPPNATSGPASAMQSRPAPSSLGTSTTPHATAFGDAPADHKSPAPGATPVPTTVQATEVQPDLTAQSLTRPSPGGRAVESVQPAPEVRPVGPVPLAPDAARAQIVAPATSLADSEALPSFGPDRAKRKRVALAALWVATAVVPATIVWFAKPPPKAADCNCKNSSESRAAVVTPLQKPAEPVRPVVPPPELRKESVELPTPPAAAASEAASSVPAPAETSAAPAPTAAPSAASTVPVVVETDSNDRISVLVKSRPTGAKVLRRGKEIGRTPVVIQIGRGEHRIFEVGSLAFGTRRISLDGEKTEIMVNIGAPPKPDK
jgi:hypothetical protein